ncbi:MAG TPA: tubulin-like doman-containing protein, partial [Gemmataceae bacterium]|nr:tubulin-like doman-containing protein [Gemmataceae bacterium]
LTGAPNLETLPPADRPAIARALAKKPDERFPSCMELVRALRQGSPPIAAQGGPSATPATNNSDTAFVGPADFAAAKRHLGTGSPENTVEPTALVVPANPVSADRERQTQLYAVESPRKPQGVLSMTGLPLPPEKPEETGGGTLFPALVIGLGGVGLTILQQLRAALHKRIGPVNALPHIRLLHVDTDAQALIDAAEGMPETRIREKEIIVARLQRPSIYLKPGVEQQFLQSWFPLLKLKGLPRDQQVTGGWRALGRVALALHYSTIAARLRAELEGCTEPQALATAIQKTGLGLRSNRPRVYIIAHLGGGTGSGMFLDVAYGVKHLLAHMGQPRAEIVGIFLLPPGGRSENTTAAANAVAALTELNHFAQGGVFSANYLHHQESINERGPAFSRCFLLPIAADSGGAGPLQELTALAGDFLFRDLATALGRTSDECRAGTGQGIGLSAFGSYWFTVPHRLLLQRVAQRFCHALVQGWQHEDNQARERAKRAWIDKQLARWQLNPESLTQRLEAACAQTGGQTPQSACDALLATWAPGGKADLGRDPKSAAEIFKDVGQLVGAPGDSDPTVLGQALESAATTLLVETQSQLGEIALGALSEPKFRLTAVTGDVIQRQLGEALADLAKQQAELSNEQIRQAKKVLQSMRPLLETLRKRSFLGWGQKSRAAGELLDWLGDYLGMCSRSLVYRQVGKLYQGLHDNLHKHHRDVGCCWPRIAQFLRSFEEAAAASMSHVDLGLGQYLLPPGCRSLDEGAAQVMARLTPEETAALHEQIQI